MSHGGHNKHKFTEKDLEQLETMAGLGMPIKHMAAILGCGRATLERHIRDDERLAEVVEKGRGKAAHEIYKTAYEMAKSGKVPAFTMFWLKCQEGWKEGQGDEELRRAVAATTENVSKLYELARMSNSKSVA